MRKILYTLLFAGVFILAACGSDAEESKTGSADTTDIKELVHTYSTENFDEDIAATITWKELVVTEDGVEEVFELPEEEFFLSIAPFKKVTHPCFDHSLTGCQGELVNEEFDVEIIDSEGKVVMNETMETMDNGFIDLWLPRNDDYQVIVRHDDKVAEANLSTYEGDQTCVTTMQLQEI